MSDSPSKAPIVRFCVMMFIQFFIWGVWYVPMWVYLGTIGVSEANRGLAYASTGIAAIVSPFIVGMIADRFFSSQKVLGTLHLLGGLFLFLASKATGWESFFPLLLAHLICYMPTLAMVNSVCFQNMTHPEREFPPIRTLGTIGWIVSGLLVGSSFFAANGSFIFQMPEVLSGKQPESGWKEMGSTNVPFLIGAVASAVLGVFAFFLPDTPPKLKGQKVSAGDVLGLKAIGLMRERSFAVFVIASFLICIPLSFYFQSGNGFLKAMGMENSEWKMTYGQFSEIFFLFLIPFFFRALGVKLMLIIGMACWVLRYLLFANAGADTQSLLIAGILLHGICYDFFFVTGQLYVDRKAPDDIRSSAQGFIAFVTLGLGMFVGGLLNGWWNKTQLNAETGEMNWTAVWYFPAIMAGVVMVAFALLFNDKTDRQPDTAVEEPAEG